MHFHNFCWHTLKADRRVPEFRIGRCTENRLENVSNLALILPRVGLQSEFNFRRRGRNCFEDAVKNGWVQDQKLALVCGATYLAGFASIIPVRKANPTTTTTLYVQNVRKKRVLIENDDPFAFAYTKIHNAYTNPDNSAASGSPEKLLRVTKCSSKHVDGYLNSSETYTKFKLTRKRFPRLKVMSYRLNEV